MKRFSLSCLASAALFAEGSGDIPPRPRAADYPVQQTMDGLTMAGFLLRFTATGVSGRRIVLPVPVKNGKWRLQPARIFWAAARPMRMQSGTPIPW